MTRPVAIALPRGKTLRIGLWMPLAILIAAGVACGSGADTAPIPNGNQAHPGAADETEITLEVSLYLLVDDLSAPDSAVSSARDEDDLKRILEGINQIWSQAGIRLEPRFLGRALMPRQTLVEIIHGDVSRFFMANGGHATLRNPSIVNGFYVRSIGAANGFAPADTNTFFVTDNPSVHDRRVSSHEIGHILSLGHAQLDPNRLMFSGTNGMTLTAGEIGAAREAARALAAIAPSPAHAAAGAATSRAGR